MKFALDHRKASDEELLRYVQDMAHTLGYLPKKTDVPGCCYIKQRLGPWPRVLEKAGLKQVRYGNQKLWTEASLK